MKYEIYYNLKKSVKYNYKLIRDCKTKFLPNAISTPKTIKKFDNINENNIIKEKFGDYIIKFVTVIRKNFNNLDLSILYNNINTITTSIKNYKLSNLIHGTSFEGGYVPISNKINLDKKNYYLTIFHELFHASTTIVDSKSNTIFSGFEQINIYQNYLIGVGINEGYTQYLTEKYFNKEKVLEAYPFQKVFASAVEKIIGKEKMESLYFTANLNGLIESLLQYKPKNEIYKFIHTLDCITMDLSEKYLAGNYKTNFIEGIKYLNSFLIECYVKKYLFINNEKKVDKDALGKEIAKFIESLPYSTTVGKKEFILRNEKLLIDSVSNALKNTELSDRKIKTIVKKINNG